MTFLDAVTTVGSTADTLLIGWQSTIFRSLDGGVTWAVVNGNPFGAGGFAGPSEPDAFGRLPPGHPHAGRLLSGGGILYSDDRGASWRQAARSFPGEQGNAHAFAVLPSGRVLMAGNWGVAASDDGSRTYAVSPLWGDYLYRASSVTALATPGSGQAGTPACGLADGVLCDGAVAVGIDATAPYMQVWRTNDGGRTWSAPVVLPEPYDGVGTGYTAGIVALPPGADGLGRALVVGMRGVIYRMTDGAQTWEAIGRMPLTVGGSSHIAELARIGPDGHLWVATTRTGPLGDYLYRSTQPAEAAFLVRTESGPVARSGERLTVRPNPSSAGVRIALDLDEAVPLAFVSVYDAAGRRVAVLHDGPLSAGPHEFAFDADRLAPGVYVVQVRVSPAAGSAWTEARRVTVAR